MVTKKRKTRRKVASTKSKATTRRKKATKRKAATKRKTTRKKATKRKATTKRKTTRKKATKRKAATKTKTTRRKKTVRKKRKASSGLTKIKYSVSASLAAVVGSGTHTRPQIVKKIWAYIKSHKCQDTKNKRMIKPDAKLAKVIGNKPIDMMKLAKHLSKHISK